MAVSKMAGTSLPARVQQQLDLIADEKIDEGGRFKYILIKWKTFSYRKYWSASPWLFCFRSNKFEDIKTSMIVNF